MATTVLLAQRRYLDHLVDQRQRERDERLERLGNPGAYHYRGKVTRPEKRFRMTPWYWEVVNTVTDAVVAEDGPYPSLEAAMTACAKEVLAVRHAWTGGWLKKKYL